MIIHNGDSPLLKETYKNPAIDVVRNEHLEEWDVSGAHLMAMWYIDNNLYESLKKLPKLERNIEIGKMQINNKELINKLQDYLFLFKKEFIIKNKIKKNEILETTKDSITLLNKIPNFTKIEVEGHEIQFTNKDGIFTSYYRINGKSIYFDTITQKIRIKGINDSTVQNSQFVKQYLTQLLLSAESLKNASVAAALKIAKTQRIRYIENENINVFRSLSHDNNFIYTTDDNIIIESAVILPKNNPNKLDNYKEYILPILKTFI